MDKETKTAIKNIFDKASKKQIPNSNNADSVTYSKVEHAEAVKLKEKIGIDLEGYKRIIPDDSARHIVKKHGQNKEIDKTQKEVTAEDILKIREITETFDSIELEKRKDGGKRIKYTKKIGGWTYNYIELISKSNKNLRLKTIWIKK